MPAVASRAATGVRASLLRAALAAAVLATALAAPRPRAAAEDPAPDPWRRIVVLHTNDVHGGVLPRSAALAGIDARGDVGGFAALSSFVARERAAAREAGASVLLLDAGDVWRGTPEGDLTRGDLVVDAFSRLGYDAVAFGNHELDLGVENARRLAARATFPWVTANVVETATGKAPAWLRSSVVLDAAGVRVGVVGLTPPDTARLVKDAGRTGLSFLSEVEAAKREALALADRVDAVLFLTHLGPDRDRGVLAAVPRARLVVGGHTHTRIAKPIPAGPDGKAWIVQAGTACVVAGRVRLRVHRTTREVALDDYALVPLVPEAVGSDAGMAAFLAERIAARPELAGLAEAVGRLSSDLPRAPAAPYGTSVAGNLVTDAMRAAVPGADVAFANRGGLRVTLPAGPVTRRDLHLLVPFEDLLVELPLRGAELLEVLGRSIGGEGATALEVSGLVARVETEARGGRTAARLADARIGGAPLDAARTYRVVVNGFLAQGGDGYGGFRRPGAKEHPVSVRDAVAAWLARSPTTTPDRVSRLRAD